MPVLPKKFSGISSRFGGQGYGRTRLYLPGSKFDYEREAGDLWSNPIIALGIDWLGNRFPRPEIHVSRIARNGDLRPVGRHDLTDLWSRPNPHYSRRTMEKVVGLSLICDGNAYIYKVRDRMGRVVQLWWIPHFRILPTWADDGSEYIGGYKVWVDGNPVPVPAKDVIHVRDGIDPRNERLGFSATKACIREICTVNMESGYTSSLLRNSAVPGLMVVPRDQNLRPSDDEAERMRGRIADFFGGEQAGTALIAAGQYEVTQVGFSPEQLMLDKLPTAAVARVAASVGVTAMSLGLPDPNKTYSNLAEANRASWGQVVSTQELIDESLRWELLPEFGDDPYKVTVERDYSKIQELQESLDAIHARTREDWKAGLVKLNEARELLGFDVEEDEFEEGERYFPGTGWTDPNAPEVDPLTGLPLVGSEDAKPGEDDKPEPDKEDEKPKPSEDEPEPEEEKAGPIETKTEEVVVIEDGIELKAAGEAKAAETVSEEAPL